MHPLQVQKRATGNTPAERQRRTLWGPGQQSLRLRRGRGNNSRLDRHVHLIVLVYRRGPRPRELWACGGVSIILIHLIRSCNFSVDSITFDLFLSFSIVSNQLKLFSRAAKLERQGTAIGSYFARTSLPSMNSGLGLGIGCAHHLSNLPPPSTT
jgi:hypothetical protein